MALWTPAAIATDLWVDAADSSTLFDAVSGGSLVASDGEIARAEDKSGRGFNATQSGATLKPLRKVAVQNGLDAMLFDGSNDLLNCLTAGGILRNVPGATLIAVRQHTISPSLNRVEFQASNGTNAAQARAAIGAGGVFVNRNYAGGRRLDADGFASSGFVALSGTGWGVHIGVFDYANSDCFQWTNGTADGSNTSFQTAGNTSNTDSLAVEIGRTFVGYIGEIIVLDYAADASTRQLFEGSLHWKWGLQSLLPADHPYKNAAPRIGSSIIPIIRQHYAAMGAR